MECCDKLGCAPQEGQARKARKGGCPLCEDRSGAKVKIIRHNTTGDGVLLIRDKYIRPSLDTGKKFHVYRLWVLKAP